MLEPLCQRVTGTVYDSYHVGSHPNVKNVKKLHRKKNVILFPTFMSLLAGLKATCNSILQLVGTSTKIVDPRNCKHPCDAHLISSAQPDVILVRDYHALTSQIT